jgi:hypothetical protein
MWAFLKPIWHKCVCIRAELLQSRRGQFMKHMGISWTSSTVDHLFTNLSFQALGDNRQVTLHCTHLSFPHWTHYATYANSPFSQRLPHALRQVGDGFRQGEFFRVKKSNHQMHITIGGISDWHAVTYQPIESTAQQTLGTWRRVWRELSTFRNLWGQGAQMVLTLNMTLVATCYEVALLYPWHLRIWHIAGNTAHQSVASVLPSASVQLTASSEYAG